MSKNDALMNHLHKILPAKIVSPDSGQEFWLINISYIPKRDWATPGNVEIRYSGRVQKEGK